MKIVQITPGAGDSFYCENCLRDNELVVELRRSGHDVLMVPLYLPPLGVDLAARNVSPIFFGGINVYLQQKSGLFRRTPRWLDRLFDSPWLLRRVARRAGMTDPSELGEMTVSMLLGQEGRQVKELQRLVEYLSERPRPDVVCLSNALLLGLAGRIKESLGVPVACLLQDEEPFLDALGDDQRQGVWDLLRRLAGDVDAFIAVSHYYAREMARRLELSSVDVVHCGLDVAGYEAAPQPPNPPAVGFLSQMCRAKGLDLLVEAFVILKAQPRYANLRLRVAGGSTAADDEFLRQVRRRIAEAGLAGEVDFLTDFDRRAKQEFLRGVSVLAVPGRVAESFGLFVLEALASGVSVVLPDLGAMSELVAATGGGLLHRPGDARHLAERLDELLADPARAAAFGRSGRQVVLEKFTIQAAAKGMVNVFERIARSGTVQSSRFKVQG